MTEIGEMIIRLPGDHAAAADARGMGELIANRMADVMPDDAKDRHIEALDLKLSISPGMKSADIADSIAAQIMQQLNRM